MKYYEAKGDCSWSCTCREGLLCILFQSPRGLSSLALQGLDRTDAGRIIVRADAAISNPNFGDLSLISVDRNVSQEKQDNFCSCNFVTALVSHRADDNSTCLQGACTDSKLLEETLKCHFLSDKQNCPPYTPANKQHENMCPKLEYLPLALALSEHFHT